MDIKHYWLSPANQPTLQAVREANLEQEAEEKHMLVLDGKLIQPEDWPCACEKMSPDDCYLQLQDCAEAWEMERYVDKRNKTCTCPCHTYYEPEW